jgi:hypothetical protein
VSLYGLSSLAEIDTALLQAIYPLLGHKMTKIGGRIMQTLLSAKGVNVDVTLADILDKSGAELYVFDDLERCAVELNGVLGYINQFIEHDDSKVVIIANDAEIFADDAGERKQYERTREKLIGKILEVRSAFGEAFSYFCSLIDTPRVKTLFVQSEKEIASIYVQSKLNNLRILQQTMWDFERFSRALTGSHWQNTEAINTLLRLFFVYSFELKAGQIKVEHIATRATGTIAALARYERKKSKAAGDALSQAEDKYPEIDLRDTILSNQLLVDILAKGIVEENAIRSSVDKSRFFVDPSVEPAWRTVWHWHERTDAQFEIALQKMEKQFADRQFVLPGEMIQVFGLQLFLSSIGVLNKTREQIVADAKQYMDDVFSAKPEQIQLKTDLSAWDRQTYDGLGVFDNETPELRQLFDNLVEHNKKAIENTYPAKAKELMREMETDPSLYARRLCLTNSEENIYYDIPILSYIDPGSFVQTVLRQPESHQRIIFTGFKGRYQNGALSDRLPREIDWLTTVKDKFVEAAKKMSPIGKYRLLQNVEYGIESAFPPKVDRSQKEAGQKTVE